MPTKSTSTEAEQSVVAEEQPEQTRDESVDVADETWLEENVQPTEQEEADLSFFQKLADTDLSQEQTEEPKTEEPVAQEQSDGEDEELEKARRVLESSGFTKKELGALDREWVMSQADRERKRERDLQELREKLQIPTDGTEAQPDEAAPKTEPSEEPAVAGDLNGALAELTKEYGEDFAGSLGRAIEASNKGYSDRVQRLEAALVTAQQRAAVVEVNHARSALRERFPQLDDEKVFGSFDEPTQGTVLWRMNKLYESGKENEYADFSQLMEAAASLVIPDAKATRVRNNRAKRDIAQPTIPSAEPPEQGIGQDQQEELLLTLLEKGLSREEAMRRAGF